jgi:hypothetical protein
MLVRTEPHTAGLREGFDLVVGTTPRAGERVLLTRESCYDVHRDTWFLVQRVEAAYAPDGGYLHGVRLDNANRKRERLYVSATRLHVERPTAD